MINTLEIYFLLFITYAMLGWTIEVIGKYFEYHRFINRGFLIGPYCPIYGWGALFITLLLEKYTEDPFLVFILGMGICSVLEYTTSYVMEKVFKARWWDYSTKKFNINGRICLNTMIPFGLLGLLMMYVINPFLRGIYKTIPVNILTIITIILLILYIIDNVVSFLALNEIKGVGVLLEKDNTEEMSNKVRKVLSSINWREKRLINAFPNAKYFGNAIKENLTQAMNKIEERQNQIINETNARINILKEEYDNKINIIKKQSEKRIKKLMNKKEK